MPKQARKRTHFLSANKKTKFGIVSKMVRLAPYINAAYTVYSRKRKMG